MTDDPSVQPPPPPEAPAAARNGISAEERQWAMFAHLSALLGGLVTAGWAWRAWRMEPGPLLRPGVGAGRTEPGPALQSRSVKRYGHAAVFVELKQGALGAAERWGPGEAPDHNEFNTKFVFRKP